MTNDIFCGWPFCTNRPQKANEYAAIFGCKLDVRPLALREPSMQPEYWQWMANRDYLKVSNAVATEKAISAYELLNNSPGIVEAVLVFIDVLDGYPGPYISDLDVPEAYRTLIRQTHARRSSPANATAFAYSVLAVYTPPLGVQLRHGVVEGLVTFQIRDGNGFGWDSIFQPKAGGNASTFAEMCMEQKNLYSMRRSAAENLLHHPFEAGSS